MIATLDVKQELAAHSLAPELRQQIEDLLPDVDARLTAEAERLGKDTSSLSAQFVFILLIGFIIAEKSRTEQSPWTDTLTEIVNQIMALMPAATALSLRPASPEWLRELHSGTVRVSPVSLAQMDRETLYSDAED